MGPGRRNGCNMCGRKLAHQLGKHLSRTVDPAPPGQPFHLDIRKALADISEDPDAPFLEHLANGVPDTPVLEESQIWPSKAELGQTPQETTLAQRERGMVLGPFSKEEGAKVLECRPEDLCVGAMAAIQEADKVRTIFDATIIGVNDNIRSHITKKTTSPTLHDLLCVGEGAAPGKEPRLVQVGCQQGT